MPPTAPEIRNVAIIAHVDHGKTTLVDQLLRQSGQFSHGELQGDCILDSNPLERERGITIFSKNCAIDYVAPDGRAYHINIVDTPGHADFSGEVERVLKMADGVLLLVDAREGVMPQTRYVLGKALALGLPPVVVINKMDRPDARPAAVHEEVFDLLVDLDAGERALDFPTIYASARDGWAAFKPRDAGEGVQPLFAAIIRHVPAPVADAAAPLQALITTLDYNDYVGRIVIGRVFAGRLAAGENLTVIDRRGKQTIQRPAQLYNFDKLGRREVSSVSAGDLFAAVGLEAHIGETLADPERPAALPVLPVDEPTLHMVFRINDGPFAGRDGRFVTGRQLAERLQRELQSNVALRVEEIPEGFNVSGRGLLHLGILLENMRREGYELTVGKPEVIFHEEKGRRLEPLERLAMDVPDDCLGPVLQMLGERRAELIRMESANGRTVLRHLISARGLIGLRSRVLTVTRGEGVMHHRFVRYAPYQGPLPGRINGVLIATESGPVTAYALAQLADRGTMFVAPGEPAYAGQIVGEHCKDADLAVNVTRLKALTNIRSSTKEATVTLKAPRRLSLEMALEYVEQDELVELTPGAIRLRKRLLSESDRRRQARRARS